MNYEKLDIIPESKSTILNNFFNSNVRTSTSISSLDRSYLEKDGVKFSTTELANHAAKNLKEYREAANLLA